MALESVTTYFDDLHDLHSNNSYQVKSSSIAQGSTSGSSGDNLENSYDLTKLGNFISLNSIDCEPVLERSDKTENKSPRRDSFLPYLIPSDNRANEVPESLIYSQNDTLIHDRATPARPPPAYSRRIFLSNDSEIKNLANDFGTFTKSFGNDGSYSSNQFDEVVKLNENLNIRNDLLNEDKNKPPEVIAKTQNANKQIQSATTPVIRSGAMMGSLRALNNINPSANTKKLSPQPPRSNSRPPSSASLQNSIVVNESKSDISFREVPLRRVQSSMELRNLTFQTWCERRGKQYLVERRKEQLKRQQEEEEAEKSKAERSKKNEEIFAMWLAKKQQQAFEAKKKRLKEEEEKREVEESKKQLKAETDKAFEAWKSKKESQMERRHSISYVNREKAAEELRAKLEKSIAAHLAFEAWQKQANQRLKEARELESVKIREEKNRKAEMEAMRKELARTSYTQWELRKAFRNQSTRNASSNQPLVAKPPWRPTSARINLPRP